MQRSRSYLKNTPQMKMQPSRNSQVLRVLERHIRYAVNSCKIADHQEDHGSTWTDHFRMSINCLYLGCA
ncbi:hypothetical protein QJS10_CPA03g01798 [Acorus calamus]|uniref:Uncharacterized protein n=1 Tax=Acorus calamus TaxID=4465 RepID=A0AAV9F6Z6_ACOCL|nr:hypothetical protein QJS10_CPA03g01798 [Acorus calamus]